MTPMALCYQRIREALQTVRLLLTDIVRLYSTGQEKHIHRVWLAILVCLDRAITYRELSRRYRRQQTALRASEAAFRRAMGGAA